MQRALLALPLLAACAAPPPPAEAAPPTGARDPAFVPARAPARFAPDLPGYGHAPVPRAAAPSLAAARPVMRERAILGLHLDNETDLRRVMAYLSAASGVDIVVDPRAEQALDDEGVAFHVDLDRRMSLRSALGLLQELANGAFAWEPVGESALHVTTPDRVGGTPRSYVYDVSDLIVGVQQHVPRIPSFDVQPSGGLFPADEDPLEPAPVIDEDLLIDLIRNTIAPGTWDEPGNSITIQNGKLILRHR